MFDCTELLYTQAVWQCVNPQLDYCIQFTALNTSHTLLTYLQSNAVVLQLWGLQGMCTHTEAIVRFCPLTLATLVTLVMKFVYFLFCLPCAEGCSEMTSRLHSVKKTPDNNILIDTAEDSEHTVRTYLYSLSHTHTFC